MALNLYRQHCSILTAYKIQQDCRRLREEGAQICQDPAVMSDIESSRRMAENIKVLADAEGQVDEIFAAIGLTN